MKKILFIGGTDPSGGAGIQADLRSANALGAWGFSAISSVVAQNTSRVVSCLHVSPEFLELQLHTLKKDTELDAIKIGMIGSVKNLRVIQNFIATFENIPIVLDPIRFDGNGETKLSEDEAFFQTLHLLGPHVDLVTPNTVEASGWMEGDLHKMIETIHNFGPDVLLKSGHLQSTEKNISDLWCDAQGVRNLAPLPRLNVHPRGTGCHLAAAITTFLAQGKSNIDAVESGRVWLSKKLQNDVITIGKGRDLLRF